MPCILLAGRRGVSPAGRMPPPGSFSWWVGHRSSLSCCCCWRKSTELLNLSDSNNAHGAGEEPDRRHVITLVLFRSWCAPAWQVRVVGATGLLRQEHPARFWAGFLGSAHRTASEYATKCSSTLPAMQIGTRPAPGDPNGRRSAGADRSCSSCSSTQEEARMKPGHSSPLFPGGPCARPATNDMEIPGRACAALRRPIGRKAQGGAVRGVGVGACAGRQVGARGGGAGARARRRGRETLSTGCPTARALPPPSATARSAQPPAAAGAPDCGLRATLWHHRYSVKAPCRQPWPQGAGLYLLPPPRDGAAAAALRAYGGPDIAGYGRKDPPRHGAALTGGRLHAGPFDCSSRCPRACG